ncbi:MAG: hypothetical protein ABSC94_18370 [Polyangiaceae bacterium]|jgi:hypothetical protein
MPDADWRRIVELAKRIEESHKAGSAVDPVLVRQFARLIVAFQEGLVGGFLRTTRR